MYLVATNRYQLLGGGEHAKLVLYSHSCSFMVLSVIGPGKRDVTLVEVKPSNIHGRGLFARSWIRKGTIFGRVKGKRTRRDGPYVLWLDELKGVNIANRMKFINHSSRPNAVLYDDLTVVALRHIKAGEEITHNYGEVEF